MINRAKSQLDSTSSWPLDTIKIARAGTNTYRLMANRGSSAGPWARTLALWPLGTVRRDSHGRTTSGTFRVEGNTLIDRAQGAHSGERVLPRAAVQGHLSTDQMHLILVTDLVAGTETAGCPYSDDIYSALDNDCMRPSSVSAGELHSVIEWDRVR